MTRRLLFCLPTTQLSGGVKVIFEIANRLIEQGVAVDIFSFAGEPLWFPLQAPIITQKDIDAIPFANYDFVFVSNAFMIPMVLPHLGQTRGVFFCQDYESFHHSQSTTYDEFLTDDPTFMELYQIPLPIITVSQTVQSLIRERIGRQSYYVSVGIDKTAFKPGSAVSNRTHKRVLMVGNYLMPYKGMPDGFAALTCLAQEIPIELVLVTQEKRNRHLLAALPFPVEVHHCPRELDMPGIIRGCDTYCCTSWYEGLGLPGLEAFHCGVPVVSTRDFGVSDYGVDGVNLLLAEPNDPADLTRALRQILIDNALAAKLREAAFETVASRYNWDDSITTFLQALAEIEATYAAPLVDATAMANLVHRLEVEGNLTPIATFRRFRELVTALNALFVTLRASENSPTEEQTTQLRHIVAELREYTLNPKAEYYKAFRAQYDRARLVLGQVGTSQLTKCLIALLRRKEQDPVQYPATFREIEYSKPDPDETP